MSGWDVSQDVQGYVCTYVVLCVCVFGCACACVCMHVLIFDGECCAHACPCSYFPVESTQEMLDEFRPKLCVFDTSMGEGVEYLSRLLPVVMKPEEQDRGFRLWFDELIHLWLDCHLDTRPESVCDVYQGHASVNLCVCACVQACVSVCMRA